MPFVTAKHPDITILYRDDDIVAVNKPAGLLVHRSPIDRHETRFALQLLRNRLGKHVYPVHRLDKPTSGVLLFACTPESARRLQESFLAGEVTKSYLAVVRGILAEAGTIDHPLVEESDRLERRSLPEERAPQQAVTAFRRLAGVEVAIAVGRYPTSRYSLVALCPVTGRRHQLRRHMKHECHPIIGDTKYGEGRHNRLFREEFGCHRLLLSATELTFPHPVSGVTLTVTAPLDEQFAAVIERFRWQGSVPGRLQVGGTSAVKFSIQEAEVL